jgi:hypothetical protein
VFIAGWVLRLGPRPFIKTRSPKLAEILATYRSSIGDPQSGVMVHTGAGQLVLRDVRPVAKSLDIDWYGLHGFRRGIASKLYELGADEKIRSTCPASCKVACHEGSLYQDV